MTMTPQEYSRARRDWTGEDNAQAARREFAAATMREAFRKRDEQRRAMRGYTGAALVGVLIAVAYFAVGAFA